MALSFVFLFKFVFCFSQGEEPTIQWEEFNKLSWENFKAQPDPNTDVVAITASGITFQYSIQKSDHQIVGFNAQVKTLFYPEKSWCRLERANAHILSHEQLHFDITELHARKFRYQLSLLIVSDNMIETLDAIHLQIQKDLKKMQSLYDSETDFSRQTEAQAKWQEQVQIELEKLSTFKSSN
jgi:hypothetical protein